MKQPSLIHMIEQLIATPSVSCVNPDIDQSNLDVIDLLANWLEPLGFKVEILPVATGKANLIATLGSGDSGLLLAGHTDTVPYDEHRWDYDPFKLTENEQRLYGLGTSDMKAFIALSIQAAMSFDPATLSKPLTILATSDEETTMAGAKALLHQTKPKARYAIIGEPTNMHPIRMHKGILMESINITGLAGHSSNPALGHNALEAMHQVMQELLIWREELQQRYRNPLFDIPVPTLNLGHIHGGDNPNRICGQCELHIDIRPLPGMSREELRHELNQRLQQALPSQHFNLQTTSLFDGIEAMETAANSAIVKAAEKLCGETAGSVAFGTEAPYLNKMGIETLVMGPGGIAQAHQPNEYLEMKSINPTVSFLKNMITEFCVK